MNGIANRTITGLLRMMFAVMVQNRQGNEGKKMSGKQSAKNCLTDVEADVAQKTGQHITIILEPVEKVKKR